MDSGHLSVRTEILMSVGGVKVFYKRKSQKSSKLESVMKKNRHELFEGYLRLQKPAVSEIDIGGCDG